MKAIIGIGFIAAVLAFGPRIFMAATGKNKPSPAWKMNESQSRQLSEEYASRWDRNLHERVCEAQ